MRLWKRWLLAAAILIVDAAVFFIPLSAVLLGVVVIARPTWFLRGLLAVYNYGGPQHPPSP